MFTGIVEESGSLRSLSVGGDKGVISLAAKKVLEDTSIGDSIAVNGVCLTVVRMGKDHFDADVMPETVRRSNLGSLRPGDPVNLERALSLQSRLGGHIVSGHIDGTGIIENMRKEGNAVWVSVLTPKPLLRYIVDKGSIAIDGISLTVAYVDEQRFKVSIIPHTGQETNLLRHRAGDVVNLENDVLAKYVEKLLGLQGNSDEDAVNGVEPPHGTEKGITMDFLIANGF